MKRFYSARTARTLLRVTDTTLSLYRKQGKLRRPYLNAYLAEDVDALVVRRMKPIDYQYLDHLAHRIGILCHLPEQWKNANRDVWREAILALCEEILKESKGRKRNHTRIYLTPPEIHIVRLRLAQGERASNLARQYKISYSAIYRQKEML